jgi:hypothetical protein
MKTSISCKLFFSSLALSVVSLQAAAINTLTVQPPANTGGSSLSAPAPQWTGTSWQAAATSPGNKSEVYFTPADLFGAGANITIADLESITYWTNKPGSGNTVDWYLTIYTTPTGSGDTGSWYHSRLTAEPLYTAGSGSLLGNTWNQWDTSGTSPLKFSDAPRTGVIGTYVDPTLADIQAGAINWGAIYGNATAAHDYRTEQILYFSLQTASSWGNGFTGLVDGLDITLTGPVNGYSEAQVNLESTPEPGTILLMAGPLALLAISRRRKV